MPEIAERDGIRLVQHVFIRGDSGALQRVEKLRLDAWIVAAELVRERGHRYGARIPAGLVGKIGDVGPITDLL